ncbi:hypothetical protein [uncultured Marinobacter sp.]|uniref:hypothetical protein n=1 Tax=uncultured Marinobacter sp. TaxID=187379 RepID=UPI0030DBF7A3|tara:strand:+ start:274 stop:456 length:183 start_codon:yes stop_codon:yes gene_type:complete
MSLMSPEDFTREWEKLDDPKAIREAFEQDQVADDERQRPTYRITEGGELQQESGHGQAEA